MASKTERTVINAAGLVQGIVLVTFPAASTIFTDRTEYGLSSTQYGAMFLPQVALAITASLLGAGLARRISAKRVYLLGLACSTISMVLLLASTLVKSSQSAAYPMLLVATALLGAGFGLTVPVLNTYTSVFHPDSVDRSVLTLNALLGLGTALAPVLVAIFVGLGFWWGLPVTSTVLLLGLLLVSLRLPMRAGASARAAGRPGLLVRFWLYAAFAVCYGVCETMNGNWSQLDMTTRLGASATQASLALAAFWAMVTVGRVLFAAIGRWLPERATYRILPFVLVGTFLLTSVLSRPHAVAGIAVFALAGLRRRPVAGRRRQPGADLRVHRHHRRHDGPAVLLRHRPACAGRTCRRARRDPPGKHIPPDGVGPWRSAERIIPLGTMSRDRSARTLTPVTVRRPTTVTWNYAGVVVGGTLAHAPRGFR